MHPAPQGNHSTLHAVALGTPAVADDDFYLAAEEASSDVVEVGVSLASTEPARTVTLTVTETTAEDTVESIVLVGTATSGAEVVEVIDAATWDDSVVFTSTKAFASVTSVELRGHVVATAADTYDLGFGDELGLDVGLSTPSALVLGVLGGAVVTATLTTDAEDTNSNLADLSAGTYDGAKEAFALVVF